MLTLLFKCNYHQFGKSLCLSETQIFSCKKNEVNGPEQWLLNFGLKAVFLDTKPFCQRKIYVDHHYRKHLQGELF